MNDGAVDVEALSIALEAYLHHLGKPVVMLDRASNRSVAVPYDSASAPHGLLPAFLVAGEAVWREATRKGFALDLAQRPGTLLGYSVRGIHGGTLPIVMLSMMEATSQVAAPASIPFNDFSVTWTAAMQRMAALERNAAAVSRAAGAQP